MAAATEVETPMLDFQRRHLPLAYWRTGRSPCMNILWAFMLQSRMQQDEWMVCTVQGLIFGAAQCTLTL